MSKVMICADKTCDLSNEMYEQYGIKTIAYHITLDGKEYSDSVDIFPDDIYDAYHEKKILPHTSAVSIGEYQDFWKPYVDDGYEIVHIGLGSALSSTCHNAMLAAEDMGNVYVVDSQNLSSGSGHLVLEAVKMREQGLSAKEIAEKLNAMTGRVHASFVLDTLEFMAAGGRCSTVAALGANLLKLKPLICVDSENGGSMKVGKKYRGDLKKVLVEYTKEMLAKYDDIVTDKIFVTHTTIDKEYVDIVTETIKSVMDFDVIYDTDASCTIGCHCGPATLGVLFMTEK